MGFKYQTCLLQILEYTPFEIGTTIKSWMMADMISTQYENLVHLMNESCGKLKVQRITTNGWIASKTDIKITCNL